MKYIFFLCILVLSGCYDMGPGDDLRTVPVTNNPNLMPGPQRPNPLPTTGF